MNVKAKTLNECSLLDGTKAFPINHGKTTKDTFLQASINSK